MAFRCSNCAQELSENTAFCNFCGAQQYQPQYAAVPQNVTQPQNVAVPQYAAVPPPQYQPQYAAVPPQQYIPSKYAPPQPQYPPQQYPQQYQVPQQYQQPQQQQYQQPYYAPVPKKKGSAGKVILTLTLVLVLLAGVGVALYFILGGGAPNTPEDTAVLWIDSVLDGDMEKALNHTALGNEMLDLAIRQGLASSRQDAIRQVEDTMFGGIGNAFISAGMDFLNVKLSASSSTEITGSGLERVKRDLSYMANTGDAVFDNAVLSLCDEIAEVFQIGIGVSIFGFDLPTDQFISLYITKIDGKWMVLPIGF